MLDSSQGSLRGALRQAQGKLRDEAISTANSDCTLGIASLRSQ